MFLVRCRRIRAGGIGVATCALLMLARLAAAQASRPSAPTQQQAVIDLEHRWLASEDDPTALESILADDFIHVLPSGMITKAEQLRFMRSHPAPRGGERHFQDLRVRMFGSVAIANGIVAATNRDGKVQKTIFTDVFALRHGRWQAVNAQELPVERTR
jgi:hypothetical protein